MSLREVGRHTPPNTNLPTRRVINALEKLEDEITEYNSALYSALSPNPLFGRGKRRAELKRLVRLALTAFLGPEYSRVIRKISTREADRAFTFENKTYRYRITGADAVEALVFFRLASSPDARAALIDAAVEWLRDAKIVYRGTVMDVEEYVKRVEGAEWNTFETRIRQIMEREIASFAGSFSKVEGDVAAYYAWQRDRMIRTGRLDKAWMIVLHKQYMITVSRPLARVTALEDIPLMVVERPLGTAAEKERV